MIPLAMKEKLDGKRILIWGYGREGKSTEAFCKNNASPACVDIHEGKLEEIDFDKYDLVFKSPGIVMKEEHPKVTDQTNLFLEQFRDQIIGVTGTKGKSTTSSMLYHAASKLYGHPVHLVGNIGFPCLDYAEKIGPEDLIVFEMSCHQLAHAKTSPHTAVFLNLFEDHLDYYGTKQAYFEAKAHISAFQKEGDLLFCGENVPALQGNGTRHTVSAAGEDISVPVPGEHNRLNGEFVCEILQALFRASREDIITSLQDFQGLPHRLQKVALVNGVEYYDDSISTIPEAAIQAADSVKNTTVMLLGGMDRGIEYDILADFIGQRKDITFLCMYESGKRICELAGSENCYFTGDLAETVAEAKKIAPAGSAVVLSPASASYGYFKNFEERGDVFKQLVLC